MNKYTNKYIYGNINKYNKTGSILCMYLLIINT